jgi:DnaJ-class molecular chaperone
MDTTQGDQCRRSRFHHEAERGATMNESEQKQADLLANLPGLEIICSACDGKGRIGRPGYREDCGSCGGSGYELTEFGEKVLQLMTHRFRGLFKEFISGK